eukprot:INCI19638.1.p1 GENE.INCI19638.1~~INCI19638.1.p1  ORF type:complete len:541 (-),score=138.24 INCI19638.1:1635-3257(-)
MKRSSATASSSLSLSLSLSSVLLCALVLLSALARCVDSAYATTLSVKRPDELRKVMRGGDCWLVACTDMEDNEIGLRLVEKAGDSLEGECQIGSMQCRKKVEKGVTFASRYGFTAKKGKPLIFVAVNGDNPVQLQMKDYATIKDGMGEPDAAVLTRRTLELSKPIKVSAVSSQKQLDSLCLNKRLCAVVVIPSTRPLDTANKITIKKMRKKFRRIRFVTLDLADSSFSLEKLLRGGDGISVMATNSTAPDMILLKKLSKREAAEAAKVRLPAPEGPAPDQGALPFMSLCASKLDSKMGDAAIRAVFEGNKVSAEDFLTSPLTYTSDPDLMFSIGGEYYSKDAALPLLIADSIFHEEFDSKMRRSLQNKFAPSNDKRPKFLSHVHQGDFTAPALEGFLRASSAATLAEEDGARFLFKTPKVSLSKEQQEKQRAARAEAEAQKERAKRRQSKRKKQMAKEEKEKRKEREEEDQKQREAAARARMMEEEAQFMPVAVEEDEEDASWSNGDGDDSIYDNEDDDDDFEGDTDGFDDEDDDDEIEL